MDVEEQSVRGKPRGVFLGGFFVLCLAIAVIMAFATVFSVTLSLSAPHRPDEPVVARTLLVGTVSLAICAFFALVSKRIFDEWRGRSVAHVIPPALTVPIAFALGAGGLAASFASDRPTYGVGASVIFIGYAVMATWRWIKKKRA